MINNKKMCIVFIVIGVIALVFSIVAFATYTGYDYPGKTYGGDFYTGVQKAAAATSNNTLITNQILATAFGGLFLIISFTFLSLGIIPLSEMKKLNKRVKTASAPIVNDPVDNTTENK